MIRFILKRRAKKLIKQAWDAHTHLMWSKYNNAKDRADDIRKFAEAMAELAWMTGAAEGIATPDEWEA